MRGFPDFSIYVRAIAFLARKPSVFVAPLLGAAVALVLSQIDVYVTSPMGGLWSGLFTFIADVFYSYAFGVAIVQADALERGLRGTFDSAWEDARRKGGGIIVAAIGFWFIISIAQYVGAIVGLEGQLILQLVAAFFLIYTIPAAAIGGLPGSLALGGSLRAVREGIPAAALLTIAFIILFMMLPPYLVYLIADRVALTPTISSLLQAFFEAIALGYLAFPFAKHYADVAYRAR